MVLKLAISQRTEARLKAKAAAAGEDIKTYVTRHVEHIARQKTLEEISGPIAKAFKKSGMTEDELAEFLEQEKHAMRAERRAKRPT